MRRRAVDADVGDHPNQSWSSATADTVLAVVALVLVWFPAVHLLSELAGTLVGDGTVGFATLVLAVGSAYPFVAGDWSFGSLGEFAFVLVCAAVAWSVVGMAVIGAADLQFAGGNRLPQAVAWLLAYASAYVVVVRSDVTVFA
jgi:hypothetical protein